VIYFIGSGEYYNELKKIFNKVGLRFEIYPRWIPLEKRKSIIDKVLNLINPALEFLILLDNPQKITSADIPDEEGIYAIIHDDEIIYIGSSNNLRKRILDNHLMGSKDVSVLRAKLLDELGSEKAVTEFLSNCEIAFMTTKDISCSRKALEHYLIAMLEPRYNS